MAFSAVEATGKFFTVDVVLDFLLFPVWWYTAGFVHALFFVQRSFSDARRMFAVGVWVKNIFVPMFAQYDISGRLISFLMRVVMIIGRSIALVVYSVILALLLLAYLFFPFVLGYAVYVQFTGLLFA